MATINLFHNHEFNHTEEQVEILDGRFNGRCFTLKFTNIQTSVFKMEFIDDTAKIYFHSCGLMKTTNPRIYFRMNPTGKMTIALEYNAYKFLSTWNEPCEKDSQYNKDDCIDKLVHEKSMESIGCTTPWGQNKSMICKQESKAINALELYNHYFNHETTYRPDPCTFTSLRASVLYTNTDVTRNISQLYCNLDDKLTLYESYFTYSGLSLIAEIGGYVGLFLGISINQIYEIINFINLYLFSKVKTNLNRVPLS